MKTHLPQGSVGFVETGRFTFAEPPHEMPLDGGGARAHHARLRDVREAQPGEDERHPDPARPLGRLPCRRAVRGERSQGRVVGQRHRAGEGVGHGEILHHLLERHRSCYGARALLDRPEDERPYGLSFPRGDDRRHGARPDAPPRPPGIERLLAVAGGSMGGCRRSSGRSPTRTGSVAHPDRDDLGHSPQQIAFNHVSRAAILAGPRVPQGRLLRMEDRPRNAACPWRGWWGSSPTSRTGRCTRSSAG
ncbi:MAG: hypothetical protein M5R42_06190 [Rhodocyclaceae bacterium]|nr:hypothetical protein [Rhodocyclaceae bacterium]